MSPVDFIQGRQLEVGFEPHEFSLPALSSNNTNLSVLNKRLSATQEPPNSLTELLHNDRQRCFEQSNLEGSGSRVELANTISPAADEKGPEIIHSPGSLYSLQCARSSSPDELAPPPMPQRSDTRHTPPLDHDQNSSSFGGGRDAFRTPSPPSRRLRYANLISPGKAIDNPPSGSGTVELNQPSFCRPDLDELEEWTNASVSPGVFGKPFYAKPPANASKAREAARYNLRTLIKSMDAEPHSSKMGLSRSRDFPIVDTNSRSVAVPSVPRSVLCERIIEDLFGREENENESEITGTNLSRRASSDMANPAPKTVTLPSSNTDLRPRSYLYRPFAHPLSRATSSFGRPVHFKSPSPLENPSATQPSPIQHTSHNISHRTLSSSLAEANQGSIDWPSFEIDSSNPLHQIASSSSLSSNTSPLPPHVSAFFDPALSSSIENLTNTLLDSSVNPAFPLSPSFAFHRSVSPPASPIHVYQPPKIPATEPSHEQEPTGVASSRPDFGNPQTVPALSEEVIEFVSPVVLEGPPRNQVIVQSAPAIEPVVLGTIGTNRPSLDLPLSTSSSSNLTLNVPDRLDNHDEDEHRSVNRDPPEMNRSLNPPNVLPSNYLSVPTEPTPFHCAHSPPILVSFAPLSLESDGPLPASAPSKLLQLIVTKPMASAFWPNVDPLEEESKEKPKTSQTGSVPIVLDRGFLRPRYRNLWAPDPDNPYLQQARHEMVIGRVRPEMEVWSSDVDDQESHDEGDVDELANDAESEESDVEVQDPESGVVFLSQKLRELSTTPTVGSLSELNPSPQNKHVGLNNVVTPSRTRVAAPFMPVESASARSSSKRSRTNSEQTTTSPSRRSRRRKMSEDEEDPEDSDQDLKNSPVSLANRIQRWTGILQTFLKGKKHFGDLDLLELKQALREIHSDALFIAPTSPLAGYVYTIANLQPSDIPNDDKLGLRILAKKFVRVWGPDITKPA